MRILVVHPPSLCPAYVPTHSHHQGTLGTENMRSVGAKAASIVAGLLLLGELLAEPGGNRRDDALDRRTVCIHMCVPPSYTADHGP